MAMWQVVGGLDQEGVVVREGQELDSEVLPDRLCKGAIVKELEVVGNRLRYELLWCTPRERKKVDFSFLAGRVGDRIFGPLPEVPVVSPATGWVNIQAHSRNLLVPYTLPASVQGAASSKAKAWASEGSEGFALTVNMLSGQAMLISGLHPDMPLAALGERVTSELGLVEGQELQLVLGTRLFSAEDHCRTLEELGINGEATLTCIQRTTLQPGDIIVVDGLTSALELNGVTGACERFMPETGRWKVQLSLTRSLKCADVMPLAPAKTLQPGADIQIRHNHAAKELAGVEGTFERWVRSDLVEVRLVTTRAIKPQNLHFVSHELAPEVAATMLPDVDAWQERDAQPAAGLNAALGSAFGTHGRHSSAPAGGRDAGIVSGGGDVPELHERRACGEELRDMGSGHAPGLATLELCQC